MDQIWKEGKRYDVAAVRSEEYSILDSYGDLMHCRDLDPKENSFCNSHPI
jgi:hypothetical protein